MKQEDIKCPCKRTNCERYKDCEACKIYHAENTRYYEACRKPRMKKAKNSVDNIKVIDILT